MIKFTPEKLRALANEIENYNKYHDRKGYTILTSKEHPNGRKYTEFE